MPHVDKSDPNYLLRLAETEARSLATELVRTDPTAADEGRTLSPEQYHFLLKQVTDRLRKTNRLPVKPLSPERFGAFEQPFYEILHQKGLV